MISAGQIMTRGKAGALSGVSGTFKSAGALLRASTVFLAITGAWVGSGTVAVAQNITLNSVTIEGNQRVGDAAILTRAGIVPGQTISQAQLNAALQRLNASGLFETVDFTPRGSGLLITVSEFPTINRINL